MGWSYIRSLEFLLLVRGEQLKGALLLWQSTSQKITIIKCMQKQDYKEMRPASTNQK